MEKRFLVTWDFSKSQPAWRGRLRQRFGDQNEGFEVEGKDAKSAVEAWNAKQLPGAQLNPFYLKIEEVK